jgi:hypothetical protein
MANPFAREVSNLVARRAIASSGGWSRRPEAGRKATGSHAGGVGVFGGVDQHLGQVDRRHDETRCRHDRRYRACLDAGINDSNAHAFECRVEIRLVAEQRLFLRPRSPTRREQKRRLLSKLDVSS